MRLLLLRHGQTHSNVSGALDTGAPGADLTELGRRTTPEDNLRRIDAIYPAREQMLEFNTPPLLALESMMVALRV